MQKNINIEDQFGTQYAIQATFHAKSLDDHCSEIQFIMVDDEKIRPSFDHFFQSTLSGKIFKII